MDNVPVRINNPSHMGRNTGNLGDTGKRKSYRLKLITLIASIVIVAVIALAGWFLYRSSVGAQIDTNKYQAVFFTNGQVYFGKLHKLSGGYFGLTDIFYLQAPASSTAKDGSSNPQETSDKTSDVQLVKLGSEVHGPDDQMIMNKDQILFFENLKKDGTVTDSIVKYHNQKDKQ